MKPTVLAAALAAILMSAGVAAQTPAPQAPAAPKAAPKADASKAAPKADAAPAGKQLFPPQQYDFMLKERLAQGAQDTPELRQAVREELNTRELLAREARKQGIDKTADMKAQMDLAAQTVLVRAYVAGGSAPSVSGAASAASAVSPSKRVSTASARRPRSVSQCVSSSR